MCLISTTIHILFLTFQLMLPGTCPEEDANAICLSSCDATFTPDPVPELPAVTEDNQPLYFFLFTHTEDQFNHDLSEERYTRFVPEVVSRAHSHPDAGLNWTVMFQGSDAQTVAERNNQTGVADLLRAGHALSALQFGYHGHHDPTYLNRPQMGFTNQSNWADLVNGMDQWLSCLKDPAYGGCLADEGGGIMSVQHYFGEVTTSSGIFTQSDVAYEGGAASHAAQHRLPDRLLGFGYPDHGVFVEDGHREKVEALMTRLSPIAETSGSVFWADNVIKMNGGNPVTNTSGIDPINGATAAAEKLDSLDRTHTNLMLTGLASKFIYTQTGTSPTKYGYQNPESPELPENQINPPATRELKYQSSLETLDYLLDDVLPDNPNSRFLNSQDLIEMVAPPSYWQISPAKLDTLARWVLLKWQSAPPDWVSDGEDFYSLRDLFTLLVRALANADTVPVNNQNDLTLDTAWGPLSPPSDTGETTIQAQTLTTLAKHLADAFQPTQTWQVTPPAMLQAEYDTDAGSLTTSQVLYGLATIYAAAYAGSPVNQVTLPDMKGMPETYELLQDIGCLSTCSGTAWSFKPARLRPAPEVTEPAGDFALFSLNIQDFSYPALSAEVVEKVIDLHEQYFVPLDLYLTDEMAREYVTNYPQLWQHLQQSPVVAVSYHTRPPRPYAANYDWADLANLSEEARQNQILDYETHRVDLSTGLTTSEAGGYQWVSEQLGYAPWAAAVGSGSAVIDASVETVFKNLGVRLFASHGISDQGQTLADLPRRPEHADYRLFEHIGEDAGEALTTAITNAEQETDCLPKCYIGIKMHDNDFFATQSAWKTVYLDDRRRPNWNPDLKADLLSNEEQAAVWSLYEATVQYVAEHPNDIRGMNLAQYWQVNDKMD